MDFDARKIFIKVEELLNNRLASSLIFITKEKIQGNINYDFKSVLLNSDVQESFRKAFLKKISNLEKSD